MQLRARVVFRVSCAARRRKKFPKSSSWSMRLRRRARDGRRAWDCRARDFDRVSGRRQQPRQCSARRCCGELQKSFAAAEASCTPLLLVLWTMGCVCVLGVVAARPGLIGVPWSPHKPTGKRGLDVLSAVAKRDVPVTGAGTTRSERVGNGTLSLVRPDAVAATALDGQRRLLAVWASAPT